MASTGDLSGEGQVRSKTERTSMDGRAGSERSAHDRGGDDGVAHAREFGRRPENGARWSKDDFDSSLERLQLNSQEERRIWVAVKSEVPDGVG